MGKVAKEEARARSLLTPTTGAGLRWAGRDEPIAVGVEVVNPLSVALTLTEVRVWVLLVFGVGGCWCV